MRRVVFLLVGGLAYTLFLLTFAYLIGFVAGLPVLPRSVDHPLATRPIGPAVLVDLALILLFGLQHSVMARAGVKRALGRWIPAQIERSVYLILACVALSLMFAFWQPIAGQLWNVRDPLGQGLLWTLCSAGWLVAVASTYLIDHFELFGLRQIWDDCRDRPRTSASFRQPLLYKLVRHPLYTGFLIAFWATPSMTLGHALFAVGMTAYVFVGISLEERDLVRMFGRDYETYRMTVGKLMPRIRWASLSGVEKLRDDQRN